MSKGLFVTGTDTGVGKTTVAAALTAAWARAGRAVAVMKPCETGCRSHGGSLIASDAERLVRAAGRAVALELVCPYPFALPASPEAAAEAAGSSIDLERIASACGQLARAADVVVVEGAGGLLVPIGPGSTMADLARRLALPLLVVARPSLGTINHTLLTLEAARQRGLRVLGVVFCRSSAAPPGPEESDTAGAIARHGDVTVLGTLPFLAASALERPEDLAGAAEQHLDPARLWQLL